jgi:hypothetical protein
MPTASASGSIMIWYIALVTVAEARVYGMCWSDALCCKLDPGVNPIYAERSPRYGGGFKC